MHGRAITGFRRGAELLIEVPAVVVTFVMMVHVTANALLRTFADHPLPSTLETVQFWYLPIIAFLGFIAAQHRGQHIAADLIYEKLPRATGPYVLAVVFVLCALLSLGFAWFGWKEAMNSYETKRTAGVSGLVAWPTYFLVPLAFGSLTVQFLVAAAHAARGSRDDHGARSPDDALLEDLANPERTKP